MSTDEPTPDAQVVDGPPDTPEPVPGVRKSAAVHIHPVADPDAWRSATLPDLVPPKPDPEVAHGAGDSPGDESAP